MWEIGGALGWQKCLCSPRVQRCASWKRGELAPVGGKWSVRSGVQDPSVFAMLGAAARGSALGAAGLSCEGVGAYLLLWDNEHRQLVLAEGRV